MNNDIEYVKPKDKIENEKNEKINEKEKEEFIKDYAEVFQKFNFFQYLEILKETQPEEYAKIMKQLKEVTQNEFKAKLPGGKEYLSENGIRHEDDDDVFFIYFNQYEKITPESAFVVKTNNLENSEKLFINICYHSKVGMFSIKKQLDNEGKEVEGYNIPLSVGSEHKEKDKKGEFCSTYDIIFNPEVIEKSKVFFILLIRKIYHLNIL